MSKNVPIKPGSLHRPSESVKMSERKLSDFSLADRYECFFSKGFVKNALKKDAFDFRRQNRPYNKPSALYVHVHIPCVA